MTAKGMGAAVVRKEDQRFITGKGRYTDETDGQTVCAMLIAQYSRLNI